MRKRRLLSLEDATAAVDAADASLCRWLDETAAKEKAAEVLAADLSDLEARAAEDLLKDEDDPDGLARVAAKLTQERTELELAGQAATAASARLLDARRDVLVARAAALRTRAAGVAEVAAARSARTDQMLAALTEFERVLYEVADTNKSGMGAPIRPLTLTARIAGRAKWLNDQAEYLELIASTGEPEKVTALASQPMPEILDVETAAAEPVGA